MILRNPSPHPPPADATAAGTAAQAEPGGPASLARDPLVLLAGLSVVAALGFGLHLAGLPLHPAQQITAALFLLLGLAAVACGPGNGLVLLYLLPPLFNGEDGRPYFFLLEMLVYLTIVAGVAASLWRRRWPVVPAAPFVVLFLVSTVVSSPLNLGETWLEFQVLSWRDILEDIRRSELTANLNYVRVVLNTASGLALFVLAATERWTRERVVRLATATTLVYLAVTLLGLWHYWFPVTPGKFMTVAYGWTHLQGGFVGLGFSVSYFGQYALAYLPLAALLLFERAPRWSKGAALLALALTPYTILSTAQRAAYIVFAVELGLLLLAGRALSKSGQPRARAIMAAVAACVVAIAVVLLAFTSLGPRAAGRLHLLWTQGDSYRVQSHTAAWHMFRHDPALGIGTGRFARAFPDYNKDPGMLFGSLSAHDLYAQLLAEQGLVGLGSFLGLLSVVLVPGIRERRGLGRVRAAVLFLLVSLAAWLVYGLFQHTFLMRSMQLYFWLTLGLVASLTSDVVPALRVRWRWIVVLLILVALLAGFRVHAAVTQPLPPGLAVGVYPWEPGDVRWTRSGAAFVLPVEGRLLRVSVASWFVPVVGRPQVLDVRLDEAPTRRIVLDTAEWKVVQLPVDAPRGSTITVRLRASYAVMPAALGLDPIDHRRLGVQMRRFQWAQ